MRSLGRPAFFLCLATGSLPVFDAALARFEPRGYPAQILGTSTVMLAPVGGPARDFSDLVARWASGLEVLIPASAADAPARVFGAIGGVLSALAPETAAITVKLVAAGAVPAPAAPFIGVGDIPPAGVTPRARFDRGRVVVVDRADRTVLDLGGFSTGAVAQVVVAATLANGSGSVRAG